MRIRHPWMWVCFVSMSLGGCAQPPSIDHTLSEAQSLLPSTWMASLKSGPSVSHASYWDAWSSPDLVRLQALALEHNPTITIAQASLDEASSALGAARWDMLPKAEMRASLKDTWMDAGHQNRWSAAPLNLQYSLNLGGSAYWHRAALEKTIESQTVHMGFIQEALRVEVAQAYVDYRYSLAKLDILETQIAYQEKIVHLLTASRDAGIARPMEVAGAQAYSAQLKAQRPLVEQIQKSALLALSRLTLTPIDELNLTTNPKMPTPKAGITVPVPAELINLRPDVIEARLKLEAKAHQVAQAKAQFYPTLQVSGSLSSTATELAVLGTRATNIADLLTQLSLPILNWGMLSQQEKEAQARLEAQKAQYVKTLSEALEDVQKALVNVDTQYQRQAAIQVFIEAANKARDLTYEELRAGLTDALHLQTIDRQYFSGLDTGLDAQRQALNALLMLYRSTLTSPLSTKESSHE